MTAPKTLDFPGQAHVLPRPEQVRPRPAPLPPSTSITVLDRLHPFAGECWVCGGPDKRHRLADAMISNVRGGDSIRLVATAYGLPEDAVRAVVEYADKRTRQHKARWPE